jgi:hypothetical protein
MPVIDYGPWPGNTPELGVMIMTDGDRGDGARGGSQKWAEVIIIPARQYASQVQKVIRGG